MNDQNAYPHGWYSQPGQSRSKSKTGLKNQNGTSLASYLPTGSPYLPKVSRWGETDVAFTPRVTNKDADSYDLLRAKLIKVADGNNVEQHTSRRKQPISRRTDSHVHGDYRVDHRLGLQSPERSPLNAAVVPTIPSIPRADIAFENLPTPQATSRFGDMAYPNMIDTNYGTVPRYSAPAWMTRPDVQMAAAPSSHQRPHFIQPSTLRSLAPAETLSYVPYPVTPDLRSIPHRGSYIHPTTEIQSSSWDPEYVHQQSHSKPRPNLSREFSVVTHEIDGQEVLPLTPPRNDVTITEPFHFSNTSNFITQEFKKALVEAACYHNTPELPQTERCRSTLMATQDRLSDLQDSGDAATSPPYNIVQPEQNFSLPRPERDGIEEIPTEVDQFTEIHDSAARAKENIEEYDSFYTPANGSFYLAKPYTQLSQKLKEFRLLRMFPKKACWQHYEKRPTWDSRHLLDLNRDQELLACEIEKTSLTRVGDNYVTLSYCAGDPHKTAVILVDGVSFNAFANLEHAIDQLSAHWTSTHSEGEPLLLWADQISINQSDKDERSEQVQIMREIYRRSSETYVCMSVPEIQDCLSWVPHMLVYPNSQNAILSRKKIHCGVEVLKRSLMQFLVGKNEDAITREPIVTIELMAYGDESLNKISAATFQSSLAAFITNQWWRRSWVYQEFLSANSIYFISGRTTVLWHELSPLVEFICDGLDQSIEGIRKHFESQVTEEMEKKHREELEIERNHRREEKQRQRQKKERRIREEAETKRKLEEERRFRQHKEQQDRRKVEERREAQRQFQEREEEFNQEQQRFKEERLLQWRAARKEQLRQRAEFDERQRVQVLEETNRLSRRIGSLKNSQKVRHPMTVVRLHRELKELGRFGLEVMKPIDSQIEVVKQSATVEFNPKAEGKLDQKCGGRLHAKERLQSLRVLNQVPDEPEMFFSDTLTPPVRPHPSLSHLASQSDQGESSTTSQNSGAHDANQVRTAHVADSQLVSRIAAIRAWGRKTAVTVTSSSDTGTANTTIEQGSSHDPIAPSEEEYSAEHRDISRVRLGGQEIEQRDKITRLQDDFRRLDRSALASMVKGKKTFRRHSDLIALLQHSRNCLASDSRDRIYAFIGLAEPGYNIIPSYQGANKLEHVLIQTAKSIIHHDQSLRILQHVYRGRANLGVRLPSWVPDWTSKEIIYGIDNHEWDKERPFNAGKDSRALAEFHLHAEDGFYEDLKVRGVLVGEIDKIEDSELDHVSSLILSEGEWVFGPRAAREGDEVWIMYGAKRPAVLRNEDGNRYSYLGDAVICENSEIAGQNTFSSIMYGQLIDNVQMGRAVVQEIWLV